MADDDVLVRRLGPADLDAAGAVLDAAFERSGMVSGLRLAYALQAESWFCASREGSLLGVVGAYDYGPVASVGMMAVMPAAQRHGLGERLMAALLAHLDGRDCPVVFLDASAAGQRLYPKLGFEPDGETLRMSLARPPSESSAWPLAPGAVDITVLPLREDELAELAAFDAPLFGASRAAVLRAFWLGSPGRAFVARDSTRGIAGYIMAGGNHIGPWVATSPAAAARLLSAALALPYTAQPFTTCPAQNGNATALLEASGFAVSERLLHMRRGGSRDPRQVAHLYGQASLTLG
jgi:predicted N-acetyltransferase YhbS